MSIYVENEKLIRKFLFGEMPEEERFEFEERFISDAGLFEQIKTVEDELIERYVRGWMDSAESSKFENNFLTTKKRHERVEFSRQLISKLEEQKQEIIAVKKNDGIILEESVWQKLLRSFLTPKIAVATAFAVLFAIFGSWILYQNFGNQQSEIVKDQKSNVSETSTPTPAVSPPISEKNQKGQNKNNAENFDDNSSRRANDSENSQKQIPPQPTPEKTNGNVEKTPQPTKTPVPQTAPNPVLALFAGTTRSGGKIKVLSLKKNALAATLQLNLESVDYKTFQAQLTDADGNVIFQRGNLKILKSKINFNIPAKNLKRGDYIIKLSGKNDSGKNESVADFQFRVNR